MINFNIVMCVKVFHPISLPIFVIFLQRNLFSLIIFCNVIITHVNVYESLKILL